MARSLHKTRGTLLRHVVELAVLDAAEVRRVAHPAANLNGRIFPRHVLPDLESSLIAVRTIALHVCLSFIVLTTPGR